MEVYFGSQEQYLSEVLGVSEFDREVLREAMLVAPVPPPLIDPRSRNY
jgi:hypothetical protein